MLAPSQSALNLLTLMLMIITSPDASSNLTCINGLKLVVAIQPHAAHAWLFIMQPMIKIALPARIMNQIMQSSQTAGSHVKPWVALPCCRMGGHCQMETGARGGLRPSR